MKFVEINVKFELLLLVKLGHDGFGGGGGYGGWMHDHYQPHGQHIGGGFGGTPPTSGIHGR